MAASAPTRTGELLPIEWLRERCEAADFPSAAEILRRGSLSGRRTSSAAAAELSVLATLNWRELERVPVGDDEHSVELTALFTGLGASAGDVALLIACEPGGIPGVWLGLPEDGAAQDWTARLLAPGHLLGPSGPLPLGFDAMRGATQRACHLALRPIHGEAGAETPAGLLQRLLALPGDGWALVMHLRPVPDGAVDEIIRGLDDAASACARNLNVTVQDGETRSRTIADAGAERLKAWIELLAAHASEARAEGGWSVTVHVGADAPQQAAVVAGAVHGSLPRPLAGNAAWISTEVPTDATEAPSPSLLSSRDLAALMAPPPATAGRLEVTPPLPSARRSLAAAQPISLGTWLGVPNAAVIGTEDLEGHAFVSGVTGSGKSTTVARLLLGLWNAHGIPFLVLDPIKSDYEQIAGAVREGLQVLSARDLTLNAMMPWPGFDPVTHLGYVATAFRGSFSMPSPVPYVLSRVFDELEQRAGVEPAPTLHDLLAEVEALVPELGYRGEIEDNIRAALGTRLAVLTSPSRAERLAAASSAQIEWLLDRPTVVHLADLGDDEERAFVTTLLMLYVAESARVRGATPGIAHVTVLEEAHRVLPQPASAASAEDAGDAGSVAARLMTQLLAEIRSYGESLVVIDQSPAAVARDVVRNTNLKIAHRIVDPADREVIGGSIGLSEDGNAALGRLRVGEAIITSRRLLEPQALAVAATHFPLRDGAVLPVARGFARPCCPRGAGRAVHHLAEAAGQAAEHAIQLALLAAMEKNPEGVEVDRAALERLAARSPGTRPECLVWVGLRRALWRAVVIGQLRAQDVAGQLDSGYAEWATTASLGDVAATLHSASRDAPRPLRACDECAAPCRTRALIAGGFEGRLSRLRGAVRRSGPGQAHTVLSAGGAEAAAALTRTAGPVAAGAGALCLVAHAAQLEGLGDDMTLQRLHDMHANTRSS